MNRIKNETKKHPRSHLFRSSVGCPRGSEQMEEQIAA